MQPPRKVFQAVIKLATSVAFQTTEKIVKNMENSSSGVVHIGIPIGEDAALSSHAFSLLEAHLPDDVKHAFSTWPILFFDDLWFLT